MSKRDFRNAHYTGQTQWQKVNKSGEILETRAVDEFEVPSDDRTNKRGRGFAILYLFKFYNLLEELGGKKWMVIEYIISHMDYNNMLLMTYDEIAQAAGVSEKTVRRTLKSLKDANLIAHKPGVIMLSPQLMNRKDKNGENAIMLRYESLLPPNEEGIKEE